MKRLGKALLHVVKTAYLMLIVAHLVRVIVYLTGYDAATARLAAEMTADLVFWTYLMFGMTMAKKLRLVGLVDGAIDRAVCRCLAIWFLLAYLPAALLLERWRLRGELPSKRTSGTIVRQLPGPIEVDHA